MREPQKILNETLFQLPKKKSLENFSFINQIEQLANNSIGANKIDFIYRSYIRELGNRREKFNKVETMSITDFSSDSNEQNFDSPFHEPKLIIQNRIPLSLIQNHYDNITIKKSEYSKQSLRDSKTSLRHEISLILSQKSKEGSIQSQSHANDPSLSESHYKMDDYNISLNLRKKNLEPQIYNKKQSLTFQIRDLRQQIQTPERYQIQIPESQQPMTKTKEKNNPRSLTNRMRALSQLKS